MSKKSDPSIVIGGIEYRLDGFDQELKALGQRSRTEDGTSSSPAEEAERGIYGATEQPEDDGVARPAPGAVDAALRGKTNSVPKKRRQPLKGKPES
ncbi:hypothetical protein [uncultured Aureimonas sp.]|uniref:hypothetical protein n=1 Tax=uncultured Aureimonas sp. TaxID=1604662 RepID=UPI0025D1F10A|nr:hypothetical protein [uncultured Aureimonas sp.]